MPQPDVLLEIGSPPLGSRFWAHSQIICQYSGYLRSAVTTAHQRIVYNVHEQPIFIPNVSVEQFQPLLRYMYSGFLDLNMDNIFAVLLATHVLHMPHALEICRSFLSRMQAQGIMPTPLDDERQLPVLTATTNKQIVLKPIPNKAKRPTSFHDATISCPSAPHVLVPSSDSTFQTLLPPPKSCPITCGVSESPPTTSHSVLLNKSKCEKPAASVGGRGTTDSPTITDSVSICKAIVDIASCDGPVRFRRVVNKYYNNSIATPESYKALPPPLPSDPSQRIQQLTSSSFHQQMVRDINERRMCDETQTSTTCSQDTDHYAAGAFKCSVCKHTFKSEYCFLKHAKRHLIPLDRDPVLGDNAENSERAQSPPSGELGKRKAKVKAAPNPQTREVIRPLDMNVQYYPCKTCGSKFPSYYFVHKHRKLCHREQLDQESGHDEAVPEAEPPLSPQNTNEPPTPSG